MKAGHRSRLEAIVKGRLARVDYLPGGCVGEVWQVTFDDGAQVVAKTASGESTLDIEAYMLNYLADHSALPVPKVLNADSDLLVIEMISNDKSGGINIDIEAADHLAKLHGISAGAFGLDKDTLIGPLRQPNRWAGSWVTFFGEQRLLHLGDMALQQKLLPHETYGRLVKLCERLGEWLSEPTSPSLIHGDVWGGNVLTNKGRLTSFIDPAIYYAHREVEVAYTTLFNTFGPRFMDRYQEHYKLDNDFFNTRLPIYHLYPLLVHVALFGGTYVAETDKILKRFVG